MALVPVSLAQVQQKNMRAIREARVAPGSRPLVGKWRGVSSAGRQPWCGVSVGRLDRSVQTCRGMLVIPPYCPPPPPPTEIQRTQGVVMRQALVEALRQAPTQIVQNSPLQHPGLRGERQPISQTFVLTGTAAAAIAAGIVLRAAAGGVPGAAALKIPAPVLVNSTTPTALLIFTVPSGSSCLVEKISMSGSAASAAGELFWTILRSGRAITQQEFQFTSNPTVDLQFPANGDETVIIAVRNPDATGAWIVRLELDLWIWGTVTKTDDLYSRVLRDSPSWPLDRTYPCNEGGR